MSPLPSPPPTRSHRERTAVSYTPLNQAHTFIQHQAPFTGNSLRGHRVPPMTDLVLGMLNDDERRLLLATNEYNTVYVVWSYSTPIAWCVNGTWHAVTQKFSRTTSRHQSIVRRALTPALAFTA